MSAIIHHIKVGKKMFKNLGERWTLRLITITPLVALALLTVVITSFYIDKMNFYFEENAKHYLSEYIAGEQRQGEIYVKDIDLLATYMVNNLDNNIKKELDERLLLAYKTAETIYEKYHHKLSAKALKAHIVDALSAMTWYGKRNYVFVTDYEGNNIYSGSDDLIGKNLSAWQDADGRAIVLEEIQLARKYGEGYLKTRFREETGLQSIKVKDFGHYEWFLGTGIHHDRALREAKEKLLDLIKQSPKDRSGYIAIFENNRLLFTSERDENVSSSLLLEKMHKHLVDTDGWVELPQEDAHIYIHYFEPFHWHIVYGFKKGYFNTMLMDQQKKVKKSFDEEVRFVIAVSVVIALLVALLTFIVSRRIIAIIKAYKNELEHQETALRELNSSLEVRVQKEVLAHREKEKMLIQQSKMAAMGDMLSMIAHQWRQPLNQISYVLMNIDAAYEFKELTPQYMDEKVKEGTQILEYMSQTIDDFKNFFKPDKERSEVQVSEVIEDTISLVKKSLDAYNIKLALQIESRSRINIYRNELIQVILNLIGNAKDALVLGKVRDPKIMIRLLDDDAGVVIEVEDNGGGVEEGIKEKIFEPYFSTKGEQSGTGLGLYMVKTIIETHLHGKIDLYDGKEGAIFTIFLKK